jgi:hypothetical protein
MITGVFNSRLDLGQFFGLIRKKSQNQSNYQFYAQVFARKNGLSAIIND